MQKKQNKNALIWFRNDLRVHDNTVLYSAINESQNLIALYCFDPRHYEITSFGFKKMQKFRAKFLIETLCDLKQQLAKLNISLLIHIDKPEICIPDIIGKFSIDAIYLQKEWTSEEVDVLKNVKKACSKQIDFKEIYNQKTSISHSRCARKQKKSKHNALESSKKFNSKNRKCSHSKKAYAY